MNVFESVFNHLVLPPKLPGQPDLDTSEIELSVLNRMICAFNTLSRLSGQEFEEKWAPIHIYIRICLIHNQGRIEKASLLQEFRNLQTKIPFILHMVEQNAALIIRRDMRYVL